MLLLTGALFYSSRLLLAPPNAPATPNAPAAPNAPAPPNASGRLQDRMTEASFIFVAGVLAALTISFLAQMLRNETFSIDRKWGSLGNSADGWSCTTPVATLSGIIVTLLTLVGLAFSVSHH